MTLARPDFTYKQLEKTADCASGLGEKHTVTLDYSSTVPMKSTRTAVTQAQGPCYHLSDPYWRGKQDA